MATGLDVLFFDHILEVIFQSLDFRDLAACACVCTTWRLEAERIQKKSSENVCLIKDVSPNLQVHRFLLNEKGGLQSQQISALNVPAWDFLTTTIRLSIWNILGLPFWLDLIPNTLTYLELFHARMDMKIGMDFIRAFLVRLPVLKTLKLDKWRLEGRREVEYPTLDEVNDEVPRTLTSLQVAIYAQGDLPFSWDRLLKCYRGLKELKLSVDRQEDLIGPHSGIVTAGNDIPGMALDKLHLELLEPWQTPLTRIHPYVTLEVLRSAPCRHLQQLKIVDQFDKLMRPEVLLSVLAAKGILNGFESTVTSLSYDLRDFVFTKEQHPHTREDEHLHPQFLKSLTSLTRHLPRVTILEMAFSNETFRLVCEQWPQLEEITCLRSEYRYGDKQWPLDDTGIIGQTTPIRKRQKFKTITHLLHLKAFRMNAPNRLTDMSLLRGFCAMEALKIVELRARRDQFSEFAQHKLTDAVPMSYITITE